MTSPALLVVAVFVLLALALGLRSARGRTMSLEEWTVGARGFGTALVFLLMAGEIYTTFTFLGGSGWAYGKGAPAFYIIGYGALAYALSYFLLPPIWRFATERRLVSQADFFVAKYDSPALGVVVAAFSVVALLFYLVLQLKGLQIIVAEASYGELDPRVSVWIGTIVVVAYVMVAGVHGTAWTAVLKDVMILVVAVALGLYLPFHYYGGLQPMFEAIREARPATLVLPAKGQSPSWFISTVLLTALGFYTWPHGFAAAYTARDERIFRRNAVLLPIYQLIVLFVLFAGFAAVLKVPGLTGSDADLALLRIAKGALSPWLMGVVASAGVLTALVPGSLILTTTATIIARNLVGAARPITDAQTAHLARFLVPVVALAAVWLCFRRGDTLVMLLLMGYSMVTQFLPALIASLMPRRPASAAGALAGIVAGEVTVFWLTFTKTTLASLLPGFPPVITDLNVGFVALAVNVAVMVGVSAFTTSSALPASPPPPPPARS